MSEQVRRRAGRGSVGAVAAADVAYLSGAMFAGGVTDPRDAADLISFDLMVAADASEWSAFFITSVAAHLLSHTAPADEIDAEKAAWLIERLAPTGHVESPRGMPLMLRVMENARSVDSALPAFALAQMKAAIITGEGPIAAGRIHFSRVVDSGDVALLRRILIAGGGGQGRPVSREEADVLFDIHDATIEAGNDPAFEPLFVRAILQHVRTASHQGAASRGDLFQAPSATGSGAHLAMDLLMAAGYRQDVSGLVEPVALSAPVARWLGERIQRDGRTSAAGNALKQLLAGEQASVQATLRAVHDRAA